MNTSQRSLSTGYILLLIFLIIGLPLLPLIVSGRWNWPEAWIYAALYIVGFVISRVLAARRHPDLIAERAHSLQKTDAKPWDRPLLIAMTLLNVTAAVVMGLDARYGWTLPFDPGVRIAALLVLMGGYALASYALIENRFFSGVVRIQSERGHQVVTTGPYAWIRHPGYVGGLLTYAAAAVLLNSAWALLPTILIGVVLGVRTRLEDEALQAELPGYRDYAQRVRYRLIPGVW